MRETKPASAELLTRAFRGFERAALRLEQRHGTLGQKVERLERQLLDAHRRLEAVLDAVESGVAVLSRDGEIVRANRAFAALRCERSADADALEEFVRSTAEAGRSARLRHRAADGERDLAVTVVPVGDDACTRVITVQDVTEIRRQEAEGGRRSRLEALGRMAAELAHEVRNPLGSIRLFAGMLSEDLPRGSEPRSMADQILRSTSSLESVVSNLLAFASPPHAARRELDLVALARESCELLAPTCALRGVQLEWPEATECPIVADPEGMRQIVVNLLGNALQATGHGGSIHVRAFRDRDTSVLVVEDTGSGIAAPDLPRVFDPFFSRSEGGTGLGLSVVHQIAESHDGRITLDSVEGRGTCARVEIPAGPSVKESA